MKKVHYSINPKFNENFVVGNNVMTQVIADTGKNKVWF